MRSYPKRPSFLRNLKSQLEAQAISPADALRIGLLGQSHPDLPLPATLRLQELALRWARGEERLILHWLGLEGPDVTATLAEFERQSREHYETISMARFRALTRHLAGSISRDSPPTAPQTRFVTALAFARHQLSVTKRGRPWGYRTFFLTKSPGNLRRIDAPSPPLKRLLRRVLVATAGRIERRFRAIGEGGSTRSSLAHAETHLGAEVLVSFDLKDFYPSTTRRAVLDGFRSLAHERQGHRRSGYIDRRCDELVTALGVRFGQLPQGAPTSSLLADIGFFPVERRILSRLRALSRSLGVDLAYSRYADDIVVSARHRSGGLIVRAGRKALATRLVTSADSLRTPATIGSPTPPAGVVEMKAELDRELESIERERQEVLLGLDSVQEDEYDVLVELMEDLARREAELVTRQEAIQAASTARNQRTRKHDVPDEGPREVPDPDEFARRVERELERALQGSGYRLNPRKTLAGRGSRGFEITGLLVRGDGTATAASVIDLTRSQREEIRSHIHWIRTHGWTAAAARWAADRSTPTPGKWGVREERRIRRLAVTLSREFRVETPSVNLALHPAFPGTTDAFGALDVHRLRRLAEELVRPLREDPQALTARLASHPLLTDLASHFETSMARRPRKAVDSLLGKLNQQPPRLVVAFLLTMLRGQPARLVVAFLLEMECRLLGDRTGLISWREFLARAAESTALGPFLRGPAPSLLDAAGFIEYLCGMRAHVRHVASSKAAAPRLKATSEAISAVLRVPELESPRG